MEGKRDEGLKGKEIALLVVVIAVGFALRAWWVGSAPLHPDEFHYAFNMMAGEETESLSAVRDLETRFLVERRSAHPLAWSVITRWFWFLPMGWAVSWSPGFLRMPNVLMGTLLVPLAWGIMRIVADRRQALAAAGLVALCPGLVWISRTLYHDSAFTVWVAMMLLGGAWGLKSHGRWPAVLVGVGMGLALATKVSGPILLPAFVLFALVGPRDLAMRRRVERTAMALLLAMGIFVLFCDPAAYWHAIRQPSDPRYGGAVSLAQVDRVFVGDLDVLLNIFALDLPGTVLLCLLAAALAWRDGRALFPAMLLGTLVCLSPLILLHMPPLSGPHGFAPIYFVLILLAAPMVEMRPRMAMIGLLSMSAGAAFTLVVAREIGGIDHVARAGVYPPRDAMYTAVRRDLHRRNSPRQIVLAADYYMFQRAWGIIRLAELTEGAIVLGSDDMERVIRAEAWELADVAIVQTDYPAALPDSETFRLVAVHDQFAVWRRVAGEARQVFSVEELEVAGEGEYLLPGGLRVLAGRISVGDEILQRTIQLKAPVSMDGRLNYLDWRSGRIRIWEGTGDVRLKLVSPMMEDVFWDY